MKKERDLNQVKRKELPKSPGKNIISYDGLEVKKGGSKMGAPSVTKHLIPGGSK